MGKRASPRMDETEEGMEVARRLVLVSLVERCEAIQTRAKGPRLVNISVL